jgi:hypothetical protein
VDEVVIRPQAGGAPDRARARFVLGFLPLIGVGVARLDGGVRSGVWYIAGLAALASVVLLLRADFFAQTSIQVGDGLIRRTGYFGRSATCSRAGVARVMLVTLVTSRIAAIPARWLLFLDARGAPILRAYAEYYPPDELARLMQTLDVAWETPDQTRTFAQMRRDIPQSFPWALAHVWLSVSGAFFIAIVAIAAVAGH